MRASTPVRPIACSASPRSFDMSAPANPGWYSRLAGLVTTGPGTGQLVVSAQHCPEAPDATSNSA